LRNISIEKEVEEERKSEGEKKKNDTIYLVSTGVSGLI